MNGDVNPYAPPSAEPSAPQTEVPDGSLWRVEGGRLLVRNQASLPDICILGSPPEEPGKRTSVVFDCWRLWNVLLFLTFCSLLMVVEQQILQILIFGALLASGAGGGNVRVMVFEGRSTALRYRFRSAILLFVIAAVPIFLLEGVPSSASSNLGLLPVVVSFAAYYLFIQRKALRRDDGWFELRRIAPSAIARLAEIQQKVVVPQTDPRRRGNR